MDIGEVLSRAWRIIWDHKVLWIFGILASCTSASSGSGNFQYQFESGEVPPGMQQFFYQFQNVPNWTVTLIVIGVILVVLALVVLAIFLGTVGRIGLFRGTHQAEGGAAALTFGELFRSSTPYFWRVFGLNLLVGVAIFVIFGVLITLGVLGSVFTLGVGLICLIPLICLMIPVAWFVTIVVEQASIAIVLEDVGIMDGLQRGWDVVRENLGVIIVMALILGLGVSLIGGLIIGLPMILIVWPALVGLLAESRALAGGGLLIAGLCFVLYLPVFLVLNGILRGYIETAWTLTYMRLTGRGPEVIEAAAAPTE
jgi:hypothetical protein